MNRKRIIYKSIKRKHLFLYAFLILITMFMILLGLLQPYLFKGLLDSTLALNDVNNLKKYILLYLGTFGMCQILVSVTTYLKAKLNEEILLSIRTTVYKSIIFNDIRFFNTMNTGEILNRILNELSNIITFMVESILKIFTIIVTLVGIVSIMINLNSRLAVISLIFSIGYLIGIVLLSPVYKSNEQKVAIKYSELHNDLHENIINIKTIKYLNIYDYAMRNMGGSFRKFKDIKLHYAKIGILINVLMSILAYLPYMVLLFLGFTYVIAGTITVGTITALTNYLQQLMVQFNSIKDINIQYQQFNVLVKRLDCILSESGYDINDITETSDEDFDYGSIIVSANNVEYAFEDDVLFNINDKFVRGDITLITGKNGSGKTTFINLICGMLKPTNGVITVNCKEIGSLPIEIRKKLFSIVPQKVELFTGTIRENILLGENVDDISIIELANEIKFLNVDKKFLDKKIVARGMNLSGGQIQKIAILRTLIRRPKILIFDESSTFLDLESKDRIYNYIEKHKDEYITFIVSNEEKKSFYYNRSLEI